MLVCFGAAWPFSIYRSYRSGKNSGKSIFFLIIILGGYVSGTMHKIIYSYDQVIYLYIFNGFLVFLDILIYLRNRRHRQRVNQS